MKGHDRDRCTSSLSSSPSSSSSSPSSSSSSSAMAENIQAADAFLQFINDAKGSLVVVHFYADWAPQCKQMDEVIVELQKRYSAAAFARVEAENVVDLSEKFSVTAVPTVVLLKGGKVVDRVEGANVPELTKKVEQHAKATVAVPQAAPADKTQDLDAKLKKLIHAAPVMLFMKGTADEPQCGFSRRMVELLRAQDAEFSTFNILADDEVRQGLKAFSNWPTYPQLYIDGELIGGLDITKELAESGELKQMLPKAKSEEELHARLKSLINRHAVMLFMKGTPDAPRCGFSRTMVQLLKDNNIDFDHYDILGDEEVRQGLKTYSNWPTYPQLYSKGSLVGGLDIVKEIIETGSLQEALEEAGAEE
eukprot:m.171815 g.171815  ORF g.171815 m.171815 type:complete len:364 (-) comp16507_c2_seq2:174-1265(-)